MQLSIARVGAVCLLVSFLPALVSAQQADPQPAPAAVPAPTGAPAVPPAGLDDDPRLERFVLPRVAFERFGDHGFV
jgi:hypothetical protein